MTSLTDANAVGNDAKGNLTYDGDGRINFKLLDYTKDHYPEKRNEAIKEQ